MCDLNKKTNCAQDDIKQKYTWRVVLSISLLIIIHALRRNDVSYMKQVFIFSRLQTCSPEQSIPFIVTMDSTLGLADLFLCSNLTAKCVTLMLSSLSLSLPVLLVHRQKVFQFMKCDLNRNVHWKLGAAPQSCWHSDRDFNDSFMFDLWDPSAQKAHCFSQECGKAACV